MSSFRGTMVTAGLPVEMALDTCQVIVVDDDPDVRESLSILLETQGYHVKTATHGADAIGQLHAGRLPDVMVLDLDMPVMDGFEVLSQIQKHRGWEAIRIIILTALRDSRVFALGVHAYLTKPVDVSALLISVASQWSLHRAGPAVDGRP